MSDKVKEYGEVLAFFLLETLAFTSFTLGNSILLYGLFSVLTLVVILIFNSHHLKELDWTYNLVFMIPLVLFGILSICNKEMHNFISPLLLVFSAVAVVSFLCIGVLTRTIKKFKMVNAMMTIYGALSIFVLISLIFAMVKYVPFYTLIYKNKNIYYDGRPFAFAGSIPMLFGFKMVDVNIEYFNLFATCLFTSVVGLRYISPKKEKKKFILFTIFASIGLIAMLFTLNTMNIITSVLTILILLFLVFVPKKTKVLKPIFYTIVAIIGVAFVVFFLNAQESWGFTQGLRTMIENNGFLNRLFNANRLSTPIKDILNGCFAGKNLLGLNPEQVTPSKSFLFDSIIYSGTFGAIFLFVFVVFAFLGVCKYYMSNRDNPMIKNLVVGFIAVSFIYSCLALDPIPEVHGSQRMLFPIYFNPMFLIALFLIGYTMTGNEKHEALLMEEETLAAEENTLETEANNIDGINAQVDTNTEPQIKDIKVEVMEDSEDEKIDL